uniref:Uncharacterized protein n=1 Tax=Glossina austeni TaxID=7395 RepID=A0A1A9VGJ1_GLOAU
MGILEAEKLKPSKFRQRKDYQVIINIAGPEDTIERTLGINFRISSKLKNRLRKNFQGSNNFSSSLRHKSKSLINGREAKILIMGLFFLIAKFIKIWWGWQEERPEIKGDTKT